jgi:N-sulfoglucosamine sulfohydrolase
MDIKSATGLMVLMPAMIFPASAGTGMQKRPNILFVISDDQSYPYASAYGSKTVSTPAFDLIAGKGCLFTSAYVTSPGCSPSRASILTGLYPWQLTEAGTHASSFPMQYMCFPDILKKNGYSIGYTGKGWAPGNWEVSGRPYNPAGPEFNTIRLKPPYSGISPVDYASNFIKFLSECNPDAPFCFWIGSHEPHRSFEEGSWKKKGYSLQKAEIPGFLPDFEIIRGDILDYAVEIEWFDSQLMNCIKELERINELENTLIIVTSDNGMAFPDAKANCFESGIHVPLAICWGKTIRGSQVINSLVSSISFAPTILEAAGIKVSNQVYSTSLLPLMTGKKGSYHVNSVFAGRERHSYSRYNNLGYPVRAVRRDKYLFIHNFRSERWPAGDPKILNEKGELDSGFAFYDIDDSPSKSFLIDSRENPDVESFYDHAVGKRPEFELFDLAADPACLKNLATDKRYSAVVSRMKKNLNEKLTVTKDSRVGTNPEIWETYPRLEGKMRNFPKP